MGLCERIVRVSKTVRDSLKRVASASEKLAYRAFCRQALREDRGSQIDDAFKKKTHPESIYWPAYFGKDSMGEMASEDS